MARKAIFFGLAIATALGVVAACSKKDDNKNTSSGDTPTSGVEGVTNQLAIAYPGGLALSVFPTENGTSLLEGDEAPEGLAQKNAEARRILNGEGDSCLSPAAKRFIQGANETCYEFDQEMIYGQRAGSFLYGTKNGKNSDGEACLVAFARSKVKEIEGIIERRLGLVQSMLCQAKKNDSGITLPAVDETLDLKEALTEAVSEAADAVRPNVTAATVKRLADQDERPVFRYDVTFEKNGKTREFHIVHSPKSDSDNNEYRGIMWSKTQAGDDDKERHLSIRYALSKNGDVSTLVGELLKARINKNISANAFDGGKLNLNVNVDFTEGENFGRYKDQNDAVYANQNDAMGGATYISFKLNLADNSGVTSYWQNPGANYNENARGMVFELTNDTEMKGCGTSGAAGTNGNNEQMSIRKKMHEGSGTRLRSKGFYHPFFNENTAGGPNQTCTFGASDNDAFTYMKTCGTDKDYWFEPDTTTAHKETWVKDQTGTIFTKQCVKLVDGKYEIDTTETTSPAGFDLTNTADDAVISPDIEEMLGTLTVE